VGEAERVAYPTSNLATARCRPARRIGPMHYPGHDRPVGERSGRPRAWVRRRAPSGHPGLSRGVPGRARLTLDEVQISPVTRHRLVGEVADLAEVRRGRVRLAVDGPPPADPAGLADSVATELRARGRLAVVVHAAHYLRPASLRLELGRTDPDMFLDGWLDLGGLRREVLDPIGPGGTGEVLPRLWNDAADRAYRDRRVPLGADGVVLVSGGLLLGRGLPFDAAVHLRMSAAALARTLDPAEHWTLPAYTRYEDEHAPAVHADLLVLADHPDRPAVRRA
jgi:hypothetical protein